MSDHAVTVTLVTPGTVEGHAMHNGERVEFMAYRENETRVRVMLSKDGFWIPREKRHPLRSVIEPIARQHLNGRASA